MSHLPHLSAHYLLLFGDGPVARVALLDADKRLLAEMIDGDGFVVDRLIRHAVPCAPPAPAALDSLGPRGAADLRCFALD